MKIKKIICAVIALIMICGVFSACDLKNIKIPLIDEESTEESTSELTTAPPDYGAWGRSYSDYLLSVIGGNANLAGYYYEVEDCRFSLADIDGNSIPELLVSSGDQEASKVDIYTFNGYETRYIGSAGAFGNMQYVEETGIIYTYDVLEGQETHTVSFFDGENIKETWQGITVTQDTDLIPVDCDKDYGDEVQFFTSASEEPITPEEYRTAFKANIPEETETAGREDNLLTEENALAIKTGADFSDETGGEEEEGNNEAYTEVLPSGEALQAYKVLLTEKIYSGFAEGVQFGFIDIDGDETPELFVSQGESEYSAVEIYAFKDGKAALICTSGSSGETGYAEGEGIVAGTFKGEGSESSIVYKISDGESSEVWNGEILTGEDGAAEYTSDGETVDRDTYYAKYNKYFSDELTEIGRNAHPLTEEEIAALLTADTAAV